MEYIVLSIFFQNNKIISPQSIIKRHGIFLH